MNLGVFAVAVVSSFMDIVQKAQEGGAVGLEGGVGLDVCRSADDGVRVHSLGEPFSGVVGAKAEYECGISEVKGADNGYNQSNRAEGRTFTNNYGNFRFNDQYDIHNHKDESDAAKPTDNREDVSKAKRPVAELKALTNEREAETSKSSSMQYRSSMMEFHEYAANERFGLVESGISKVLSCGFEVGDMVWAKVKSHPWWPGHIFSEAFVSSSVRQTSRADHALVAFFGDSSYGWFDPAELIPFDFNFSEKSRQTTSRNFVNAVEEAVEEISRRRGLGLACKCRNKYNFRSTNVQGYFVVEVPDYEQGAYSENQIKKARDGFVPQETLDFIQQLALVPQGSGQMALDFIKKKATVFAYRKAVFEEFDETYSQAFGMSVTCPSRDAAGAIDEPVKEQARGINSWNSFLSCVFMLVLYGICS